MIKFAWGVLVGVYLILGIAWFADPSVEIEEVVCSDTECENRNRSIPDVEVMPNMFNKVTKGINDV